MRCLEPLEYGMDWGGGLAVLKGFSIAHLFSDDPAFEESREEAVDDDKDAIPPSGYDYSVFQQEGSNGDRGHLFRVHNRPS